jgi:hypothetical protein
MTTFIHNLIKINELDPAPPYPSDSRVRKIPPFVNHLRHNVPPKKRRRKTLGQNIEESCQLIIAIGEKLNQTYGGIDITQMILDDCRHMSKRYSAWFHLKNNLLHQTTTTHQKTHQEEP